MFARLMVAFVAAMLWAGIATAREVPVEDFFKDAEFTSITVSPDGQHMAVTVPQEDRTVLAVLRVSDRGVVGKWDYGADRHFRDVIWANDERLIFVVTFKTGKFDFETAKGDMYASNIDGTRRIDIPNGMFYDIIDTTPDDPRTVLVQRSVETAFLFKLNVYNGNVTPVVQAPVEMGSFLIDHEDRVRFVFGANADGGHVAFRRDGERWTQVHSSGRNTGSFVPLGFAADNRHVYVSRSRDGEPAGIYLVDTDDWSEELLSRNERVSPGGLLWSHDETTLLAVRYHDGLPSWDFVAPEHPEAKIYAGLIQAFPGKAVWFAESSGSDGRYITLRTYSDTQPSEAFLFDRDTGRATYLASAMDWIKPEEMSPMRPVSVTTRDGLEIHGYLTIPKDSDGRNLPLIVNPHGGPHGPRDYWGFNPEVQLFANRGYAVLQMNYRGSGGYGSTFEGAGYRKWGTAMQDDLTDSVAQLVREGIVDGSRVCIYGASYGGYAALMSAVREPDLYRCSVGYVGVYDLEAQYHSDINDHEFGRNYLRDVLPPTDGERRAHSPAYGVANLRAAVMLVHGRKDQRVPIRNMFVLIDQMKKVGKEPEEVIVEDKEAHGFRDLENQVSLYNRMLAFFDRHIGRGRTPPAAD
ncbi:S9 family peptidase [Arenimonas composti]|nr:prolyl oligopeptidase family serine peptidase [Arenimonas composti]